LGGFAGYLERRGEITKFLEEDIGIGDITSNSVIPPHKIINAVVICTDLNKSITCGLDEAQIVFDVCNCNARIAIEDGSSVSKGDIVMSIDGEARSVLKAERTALNLIMRMSGIATITRAFVKRVEKYGSKVRIAGTRKTAPGLRSFDKKAITIGGGYSHRMRLDSMVLIKDNHLSMVESIERSVQMAKSNVGSAVKIECEVKTTEEAIRAAKSGANVIMLDNFTPSEAAKGVRAIRGLNIPNDVEIEVSGGINLSNIKEYVKAQPNIISVGYLTHSPKAIDYSLEIVKKT
jgi:nicotinate-nucleotide pyrophosphorylase (carboxylating)